jgi:hypothetical protein
MQASVLPCLVLLVRWSWPGNGMAVDGDGVLLRLLAEPA